MNKGCRMAQWNSEKEKTEIPHLLETKMQTDICICVKLVLFRSSAKISHNPENLA
jgi:hypothetical protein